jgi:hypothetical protein
MGPCLGRDIRWRSRNTAELEARIPYHRRAAGQEQRTKVLTYATERNQVRGMKMTENLNNACTSDVASITRERKLHTSNKISRGSIESSLEYLRSLLKRPTLALLPARIAWSSLSLARFAGYSFRYLGEAMFSMYIDTRNTVYCAGGWIGGNSTHHGQSLDKNRCR